MIKKLLNTLFKNKKNSSQFNHTTNSIVFEIDKNNKINLKVFINDTNIESADKLGVLLFLLNEGYYVQGFLDILSDLSKQDPNNDEFVKKIINSWSTKVTEIAEYESQLNINEPIIKPTQFNVEK